MSKRRQLLRFALLGTFWGTVVGVVGAFPLIFFYVFGFFGLFFGVLFSLIPGALIGLVNGIIFAILTFYVSAENEVQFHRRMLTTSILVTLIASFVLYIPILYLLARYVVSAAICASPIAVGAAIPVAWASQRVAYRGADYQFVPTNTSS